jgi:hypothetical protein
MDTGAILLILKKLVENTYDSGISPRSGLVKTIVFQQFMREIRRCPADLMAEIDPGSRRGWSAPLVC